VKKRHNYYSMPLIVRRTMQGRITPVNFLILVGFAATLALFYICMHVYSYTISEQLSSASARARFLREKRIWLMADYNSLISPDKIIPEVQRMGMRPGSRVDISELTLYGNDRLLTNDNKQVSKVSSIGIERSPDSDRLEN